jgi:uncharacterized membrane protein
MPATRSAVPPSAPDGPRGSRSRTRRVGRLALGGGLAFAGVSHLTVSRTEFQAQVPSWFPADPDLVVVVSGVVEIVLGLALVVTPRSHRWVVGWVVAAFFVVIFPGNVAQYVERTDGFGLDTDRARAIRLLFQPLLVLWALWSTAAWRTWRQASAGASADESAPASSGASSSSTRLGRTS